MNSWLHFLIVFREMFENRFSFGYDWLFSNIEEKAAEIGEIIDSNFIIVLVVESSVEQFFVVEEFIKLVFPESFVILIFFLFYCQC